MAIPYTPPGISVTELSSPSVNTALSTTNTVCLIGPVQGYAIEAQQITIPSGVAPFNVIVLTSGEQFVPISAGQPFVSVTNAVNPTLGAAPNQAGYQIGVDYTVSVNIANNVATVTPISSAALSDGGIINFTYQVLPSNYYQAQSFSSQAQLEALYGPAYSVAGIQTSTAAGASAVIENGQQPFIVQPLFVLSNPADPTSQRLQPSATQIGLASTWQQTLYALRAVQGVNFIVPIVSQSQNNLSDNAVLGILEAVQDHIYYMETSSSPNEYIFGIFGEDNTANNTLATDATLQSHALTLAGRYGGAVAQNLVLFAPASFGRPNPSNTSANQLLAVGGEYAAAGFAGLVASRAVTAPVTRQIIANLQQVNSYRDLSTKNADAQAGLCVLEQNGGTVRVRHAITLDNSSIENRTFTVVRAKFHMISSLIEAYDTQIIGQIPANGSATTLVMLTTASVLQQLQTNGELVSFSNLQARLLASNPTACEVRFSWLPAFELDNIDVIFSLDLTGASSPIISTVGS